GPGLKLGGSLLCGSRPPIRGCGPGKGAYAAWPFLVGGMVLRFREGGAVCAIRTSGPRFVTRDRVIRANRIRFTGKDQSVVAPMYAGSTVGRAVQANIRPRNSCPRPWSRGLCTERVLDRGRGRSVIIA